MHSDIISNKISTKIDCTKTISEYISGFDWRIKANANTGYSYAGLVNNTAGKIIANYWLDEVYNEEESQSHRNGDLYIHDLDVLAPYCAGWSLRELLDTGFNGVAGRVSSKPPRHFSSALGQMANFFGILQSEWAGAQAFSSFDTFLAPYVFLDQLSYREVKDNLQQFVYNLNVPARWGQSPFTNITLDINVPDDLKNQYPTNNMNHLFENINDKDRKNKLLKLLKKRDSLIKNLTDTMYKHFEQEMEMINLAYYEIMTEGDSTGQPFTFPIPTVNITEDFDWNSKTANAIFENTAKMGCSYFQNFVGSQYVTDKETGEKIKNKDAYTPGSVRSMCCRLQLDLTELKKRGNGLFGSAEMTGSVGVVTINMARLGYLYKGNKEKLYEELNKLLLNSKNILEKKRVVVQELYDRGLYPYTKRYLPGFMNHFSTIGINGVNEMIRNFTGDKYDISSEEYIKFSIDILNYIRKKMVEFQEETGHLYNCEATPAEGCCYKFAREDKKRFPDILQAGTEENNYYTNSSQLPSNFTNDPFEALELQNELQCKYTGGTVLHMYMNERLPNSESCKSFVKSILYNYQLPYITISPVFSVCDEHGYLNGEQPICPHCGKKTKVWTRVMGYFRPVDSFNKGKTGEHNERQFFCAGGCNE